MRCQLDNSILVWEGRWNSRLYHRITISTFSFYNQLYVKVQTPFKNSIYIKFSCFISEVEGVMYLILELIVCIESIKQPGNMYMMQHFPFVINLNATKASNEIRNDFLFKISTQFLWFLEYFLVWVIMSIVFSGVHRDEFYNLTLFSIEDCGAMFNFWGCRWDEFCCYVLFWYVWNVWMDFWGLMQRLDEEIRFYFCCVILFFE